MFQEDYIICRRVITQNKKYYSRFPQDVAKVQRLVLYLNSQPGGGVRLPRGGVLTPRGVQLLGMTGLGSAGGFERMHFLLERIFDGESLSLNFLIVRAHTVLRMLQPTSLRLHAHAIWLSAKKYPLHPDDALKERHLLNLSLRCKLFLSATI